jgi:hypothetical protein
MHAASSNKGRRQDRSHRKPSHGNSRNRGARRSGGSMMEMLENRTHFSVAEPNNSFAQAFTPSNNIYLEQNFTNSDSVSTTTDSDDYYKFYNLYGKSHLYAALDGLSSDADLYVYDQNQNLVASSSQGGNLSETINADLAGNQYFYVRVHAYSGATNYGLFLYNDYAGSTQATARDVGVSWGQASDKFFNYNKISSEDYLDYRDNVDYVKFTLEAPGTISLRMKDFTYSGNLVARMQLLDANGNVLTDTSGTVGNGLNVDRKTLNSGTYYVKFTQISGSDPYTFRIVSDYAGDTTGTARNLGDVTNSSRQDFDFVGGPFGLPTYEDATDLYKFTLSKTSPLDLRLTIAQGLTPPTFDASLQLARDSNGDGFIESNEVIAQSANTGNDAISTTLGAGTYYAVVNQNGAYTSYELDLDSDFDANPGDPKAYSNFTKATQLGTLSGEAYQNGGFGVSAGDFTDFYKFTLASAGSFTASAQLNPVYSRTTSPVSLVVFRDLNANGHFDAGENVTPYGSGKLTANLAAGTYYLETAGNGQQAAYTLRTFSDYAGQTLPTARNAGTLSAIAKTFKDYVEQPGFGGDVVDLYKFNITTAKTVTATTTGVAGEDLVLQLIRDANNNGVIDATDIIAASNHLNSPNESIIKPLAAGTYFARVAGVNGATNYTLSLKTN